MAKADVPSSRADLSADDPRPAGTAPVVDPRHPEILPPPDPVTVVVREGRSVQHQAQVGTQIIEGQEVPVFATRVARPGEQIQIRSQDLPHLVATGFVRVVGQPVEAPPDPPPEETGADANRGRVTIDGDDGTVVRAGERRK
jgi:hypothetical protein